MSFYDSIRGNSVLRNIRAGIIRYLFQILTGIQLFKMFGCTPTKRKTLFFYQYMLRILRLILVIQTSTGLTIK